MQDVFISYSTKNKKDVEVIRRVLSDNGITSWYAPEDISGDEDFTKIIPKEIRESKCLLLVMSKEAQASKWVHRELGIADNLDRPIFVMYLDEHPLQDEYELVLQYKQQYPYSLGFEEQMRRLIKDYRKKQEIQLAEIKIEHTLPEKNSHIGKRIIIGTVLLAILAAVTVCGVWLSGEDSLDGSYVIWNPDSSVAMTNQIVNKHYLAGEEIVLSDNRVTNYNSTCVWNLDFDEENTFTISFGGKMLGMQEGYNGLGFDGENTADRWELADAGNGLYYVRNVQTGYYLEWFIEKKNWATYNELKPDNYTMFQMKLEKVS